MSEFKIFFVDNGRYEGLIKLGSDVSKISNL